MNALDLILRASDEEIEQIINNMEPYDQED